MDWKQTGDNVVTVRLTTTGAGWKQSFLKLADVHFDSPHCNRRLLKSLLDEALDMGAPVSIYGDWNDVMQSRNDPRRSLSELKKEYAGVGAYADAVVDDSVEFLRPYADILMHMSDGNHDTKARKYMETDLVERICRALGIPHMGYAGFERYMFESETKGHRASRTLFFHHGKEGGTVSRGTQRAARWQDWAQADIYIGGHIHQEWRQNRPRLELSASGREVIKDTLHISLPTLKEEFDLRGGYAIEKALAPSPIGGAWLVFEYHARCPNQLHVDALRAR